MAEEHGEETPDRSSEELEAELAVLAEENDRLRRALAGTKRTRYRNTALGLAALGLLAVAAGILLPGVRQVLFVLGAIGLFGAVLTVYVTPERFLSADIGRSTYLAFAENHEALAEELGLAATGQYVPIEGGPRVRLFLPQGEGTAIPDAEELESTIVVTDATRGVAFDPVGSSLLGSTEPAVADELGDDPEMLATQLCEALVEQFELVRSAEPDLDPDGGRLTVAVSDSAYGPVDRFDHPVASVLAAGVARGLGVCVRLDVERVEDGRADYLVTCRWDRTAVGEG